MIFYLAIRFIVTDLIQFKYKKSPGTCPRLLVELFVFTNVNSVNSFPQ